MIGIVIAQLYRLGSNPDPSFGYYAISKPISCIFQGAAMLVGMLGTIRYFRQQNSMAIGRAHAGGFEILTICISAILVSLLNSWRPFNDGSLMLASWCLLSSPCRLP